MRKQQQKKTFVLVVCLTLAAALCGGQILLDPRPRPSLAAECHTNYCEVTNRIPLVGIVSLERNFSVTGYAPQWNTNGALWGYAGLTSLLYAGNYTNGLNPPTGMDGLAWGTNFFYLPTTALTRRHVYFRGHNTSLTNGQFSGTNTDSRNFLRFITLSNEVVFRRMIATCRPTVGDSSIGLLESNLPPDIAVMPMASDEFARKASGAFQLGICNHGFTIAYVEGTWGGTNYIWPTPFHHPAAVSGDSGAPQFYLWKSRLVMTGGRTTSGYSPEMQAALDRLTVWAGLNTNDYQITLPSVWKYREL